MTNKIKILPQSLSNKIAAGEVVNRPESVVKELIENSIDANATEITLIIKDAGKSLIQVIDDGDGMDESDALISFQRHSTSKISTYEDLENIITLGFRGEALASICSISHVEMKTKTQTEDVGILIRVEGNELKETAKISCEKGTSIAVKNIFYNTPGRRNFLKSNQTEFKHIYDSFIRLAISHPGIAFKFINNDELLFDIKSSALQKRIQDLFTAQLTDYLIQVNSENQIIKINGLISKPNFTKKSKQDQYFYLNGRFFVSKSLNFSVYSGYDHLIEKGDYPSFFLFIEIDPSRVDVNVHPSKLEVKFEDEGAVFGFIRNAVKDALKNAEIIFEIGFNNKPEIENTPESFHYKSPENSFTSPFKTEGGTPVRTSIHSIFEAEKNAPAMDDDENLKQEEKQSNIFIHTKKSEEESFSVWQFHNKYIMCQTETGLMVIDQHAAHERILYEKAIAWLNSQSSFSQQLLIPLNIKLTKLDYQLASTLKEELSNLGFMFKLKKEEIIELSGLPSDVKIGDEEKIFQDLIDQYKEYELKLKLDKRDNLAKSFACRGAIKSGDRLSKEEIISLIDNLFSAQMPYVCPHGRPTVIRITTEELDKRFSRT